MVPLRRHLPKRASQCQPAVGPGVVSTQKFSSRDLVVVVVVSGNRGAPPCFWCRRDGGVYARYRCVGSNDCLLWLPLLGRWQGFQHGMTYVAGAAHVPVAMPMKFFALVQLLLSFYEIVKAGDGNACVLPADARFVQGDKMSILNLFLLPSGCPTCWEETKDAHCRARGGCLSICCRYLMFLNKLPCGAQLMKRNWSLLMVFHL